MPQIRIARALLWVCWPLAHGGRGQNGSWKLICGADRGARQAAAAASAGSSGRMPGTLAQDGFAIRRQSAAAVTAALDGEPGVDRVLTPAGRQSAVALRVPAEALEC
jgi:hypothetical protein